MAKRKNQAGNVDRTETNPQPPDSVEREAILRQLDTTMLVEASAGSGKTSSMVGRMVALLAEGKCTADTLAAITFTRKAAAELRARFQGALERAAREASEKGDCPHLPERPEGCSAQKGTVPFFRTEGARERLAAAAEHAARCYIGTIHSFCARLLRERPVEAGVDLAFEELDEAADLRLRAEAWEQYVARLIAAADPVIGELEELGLAIGDLAAAFESFADYPDVARWPAAECEPPDLDEARNRLRRYVDEMRRLLPELPEDPGNDTLMVKLRRVVRMARQADLGRPAELMEILAEFGNVKVVQRNWPGGKSQAAAEHQRWQKFAAEVAEPLVECWHQRRYPVALRVLRGGLAEYERLRAEAGGLNYQDLLMRAAALLRDKPAIRRYFRRRFTHLLVDEFQDTDPIQAEVMLLAAADDPHQTDWRQCRPVAGSLFVVGDPKQSIYRFRRADIVTYNEVKRIIAAHGQVVTLWSNFRSVRPVVEWVNRAFDGIFPAVADAYAPERFPMESAHASDDTSVPTGVYALPIADRAVESEAEQIAAIIAAALLPRPREEEGDSPHLPERPGGCFAQMGAVPFFRPGDFLVVCMRKRNLGVYAGKLAERGIPSQVTGGTLLNETAELRLLCLALEALAQPDNPVALVAALRSGLFGVSDVELYRYRRSGGRFTLLAGEDDLKLAGPETTLGDALARLRRYGQWLRRLPPLAAVERIVGDLGLMAAAAARAGGNVAAGSLARAIELLRAAQGQLPGLDELVEYLRQLVDRREPRDGLAALPAVDPPVRIMNLHQAKGLEAAVVFLADPTGWSDHDVTLHVDRRGNESCGYLALYGPTVGWQTPPLVACPAGWTDLAAEESRFMAAEQHRQFYVAATRAGRQLIISCPEKPVRGNAWEFFREQLGGQPTAAAGPLPSVAAEPETAAGHQHDPRAAMQGVADRWATARRPTYAVAAAKEIALAQARPLPSAGEHGTEWGSVVHFLLEAAMREPAADLRRLACGRLASESLDPALAERAIQTVQAVTRSEVWGRAHRASRWLAEVPFTIFQFGREEKGDSPHLCEAPCGPFRQMGTVPFFQMPTLVRGVIDLAFLEDGAWVIVDYKTDAQPAGALEAVVAHYRPQLETYAAAWREMLGQPVRETGLYFTHLDRYVVT